MANKEKIKLTRAEKRQLQALMRSRQQRKKPPHSVQETIPYERMWPDGICRVSPSYYTKTVQFWDINYQLAQNEDKSAILSASMLPASILARAVSHMPVISTSAIFLSLTIL